MYRDLSNNHIGGSVPSSLPASLVTLYVPFKYFLERDAVFIYLFICLIIIIIFFFLVCCYLYLVLQLLNCAICDAKIDSRYHASLISDNNLTGSIPSTISTLPALTTLYVLSCSSFFEMYVFP